MDFIKQYAGLVALVILAISGLTSSSVLGAIKPTGPQHYQVEAFLQGLTFGTANQSQFDNAGKLTVGATGTATTQIGWAACNLIGTDASLAASSTAAYDCAVPGLTSSAKVLATLASSTPRGGSSSWEITGALASTTAGYATVLLTNNGPAAVPSATSVGSSTVIYYFR